MSVRCPLCGISNNLVLSYKGLLDGLTHYVCRNCNKASVEDVTEEGTENVE